MFLAVGRDDVVEQPVLEAADSAAPDAISAGGRRLPISAGNSSVSQTKARFDQDHEREILVGKIRDHRL